MPFAAIRLTALLALFFIGLPGCNYFQGSQADLDADLAELEDDDTKELDANSNRGSSTTEGELELKLKVGDRFPLTKRVEQRLTQADGQGMSVYRSLTEMLLSLSVDEIRDGNKLLSVRYHRVRYGHDIAGKRVEYSSDSPQQAIPPEALAYAGLHENGFSFWIGPDNRVVELVGFAEFLQRCVRDVPPQHRQSVLAQLEGTQNENDLANFVDDGIGLLPYSNNPRHPAVAVKVGSSWDLKPRMSVGPIPMQINTRCVVKELTDSTAEISMIGKVIGDRAPVVVRDGNGEMRVFVKGGHCSGTCKIDRRTGLPTSSQVNRYLEMSVKLADGSEIQQRKDTLTSISSYLDQQTNQPQQTPTGYDSNIQQTGHSRETPVTNRLR